MVAMKKVSDIVMEKCILGVVIIEDAVATLC